MKDVILISAYINFQNKERNYLAHTMLMEGLDRCGINFIEGDAAHIDADSDTICEKIVVIDIFDMEEGAQDDLLTFLRDLMIFLGQEFIVEIDSCGLARMLKYRELDDEYMGHMVRVSPRGLTPPYTRILESCYRIVDGETLASMEKQIAEPRFAFRRRLAEDQLGEDIFEISE
jgi:hypothetical protein